MKKSIWAAVLVAAFFTASAANAEELFSFNKDNAYATLNGGVAMPNKTTMSLTEPGLVATGSLHYKTGYTFGGTLGLHLNPFLAAEADINYSHAAYDHLSGTINGAAGSLNTTGRAYSVTGFANGIITPLHAYGVSPYFGGGVGAADIHARFDSVGGVATDGSDTHNTDFAADFIAGVDVPVSPQFSLGARYQYVWINSSKDFTDGAATEHQGNFSANVITARATYHF